MSLKSIQSSTVAMLLGGVFLVAVGTYTDNGGFHFAGGILLLVALIVALNQAQGKNGNPS